MELCRNLSRDPVPHNLGFRFEGSALVPTLQVRFVHNRCLVHHNPNPQLCALGGGVWDDSVFINPSTFGGRCITQQAAESLLMRDSGLEVSESACHIQRGNSISFAG